MSLSGFIKKLNIVSPADLTIRLEEDKAFLSLNLGDAIHKNVVPEKPFPISHPEFVILKDYKGSHICTVKDTRSLDVESRESLRKLLDILYFIPRIMKITGLEGTGDKFEWKTETERGTRKFTTRGRNSITFIQNKIVISDIDENLYQIENVETLDAKSMSLIQLTL